MAGESRFALYFSHSWRPRDIDLTLLAWNEICDRCDLLVDAPDEAGPNPPYYISRIEELLRRSDLFLSVLTYRDDPEFRDGSSVDYRFHCSPWALFEIRLAERLNIPRMVLYERRTGFKPPPSLRSSEVYIPFERGAHDRLPDQRTWTEAVAPKVRQWIARLAGYRRQPSLEQSILVANLLPRGAFDDAAVASALEETLDEAGYQRIESSRIFRGNSDAFRILHAAGLAIVDLADDDPISWQLLAITHALGVPTIRTTRNPASDASGLPWLLQGHPGGYQHDIVRWKVPEDVTGQIGPRARAMFRISRSLDDEQTRTYLNSKRYSRFFVFISHTLKPPHRALVEECFELLRHRYVIPFEYHLVNDAGTDWREALDAQLEKTTHFVVLLSDGYEQSPVCTYELDEILKRKQEVVILPFMIHGRAVPHPRLGEMRLHHRLLGSPDAREDAGIVVETVMKALDESVAMTPAEQRA